MSNSRSSNDFISNAEKRFSCSICCSHSGKYENLNNNCIETDERILIKNTTTVIVNEDFRKKLIILQWSRQRKYWRFNFAHIKSIKNNWQTHVFVRLTFATLDITIIHQQCEWLIWIYVDLYEFDVADSEFD